MDTIEINTLPCFYRRADLGVLHITGSDRLDLLHRLTTNDLLSLKPGQWRETVLTNSKGRIIDLLSVYCFEDHLLTICSNGNQSTVLAHLEKYTITEDFHVEDATNKYSIVEVFPSPGKTKTGILASDLLTNIQSLNFSTLYTGTGSVFVGKNNNLDNCYITVYQHINSDGLKEEYRDDGFTEMPQEKYELLRISTRIPKFGKELTNAYNPLDAELERAVSYTKGCYLGQEIIARLHSQKKVQHKLTKMELVGMLELQTPLALFTEEKQVGTLTSSAVDKEHGKTVALGYVDRDVNASTLELQNDGKRYDVVVK